MLIFLPPRTTHICRHYSSYCLLSYLTAETSWCLPVYPHPPYIHTHTPLDDVQYYLPETKNIGGFVRNLLIVCLGYLLGQHAGDHFHYFLFGFDGGLDHHTCAKIYYVCIHRAYGSMQNY